MEPPHHPGGTTPRWLDVAQVVLGLGFVSGAFAVYGLIRVEDGFLYGLLFALPAALASLLLLSPILWGLSRHRVPWTPSQKLVAALCLFGGMLGHVAAGGFLAWRLRPPRIPTVARADLFGSMPPVPSVTEAPAAGILDLSPDGFFFVDPGTGAFQRWQRASDDGADRVLWSRATGELFALRLSAPVPLRRLRRDGTVVDVALPPEAVARTDTRWTVTQDGHHAVSSYEDRYDTVPRLFVTFHPLDAASAGRRLVLPLQDHGAGALAVSPDGQWLAYRDMCEADPCRWVKGKDAPLRADPARCAPCVWRANLEGGSQRILFRAPPGAEVRDLVVSPDGARVAGWIGWELTILASDGSGGRPVPLPPGDDGLPSEGIQSFAWSPDSRRIAFLSAAMDGCTPGSSEVPPFCRDSVYTMRLDGSELRRLSARTQDGGVLVWLP